MLIEIRRGGASRVVNKARLMFLLVARSRREADAMSHVNLFI